MKAKLTHRKRVALLTLLGLVGLLAVPVVLIWRQVRQEQLSRSLLLAVRRNDTRAVITLLAQGADPNERELPLHANSVWLTLLEELRGRHPKKDTFPTALLVALYWRQDASGAVVFPPPHNFALVKALVDSGANVNVADTYGTTPLIMAAREGQRDVVRCLIEHGANVNANDEKGNTPLSCVAAWHDLMPDDAAIVNALLDRGAAINGAYYLGTTPLMFAIQSENSATVRLLLARHADVNRKDGRGLSALSLAQSRRDPLRGFSNGSDKEVLKLLKQAGAK